MAKPTITSQFKVLEWPKGVTLDDQKLIEQAQMRAYEVRGNESIDLTSRISFNHGAVNVYQIGEYQTIATVVDQDGNTATYSVTIKVLPEQSIKTDAVPASKSTPTPTDPAKNQKLTKGLIIGLIAVVVILLVAVLVGVHQHKAQRATNASQASQISQNSQQIKKDNAKIQKGQEQLNELKAAVQQYQQDQNQAQLLNQLAGLKAKNNELNAQAQTELEHQRFYNLNKAIDNMNANPTNSATYLRHVENNAVFSQPWSNYLDQAESIAHWN